MLNGLEHLDLELPGGLAQRGHFAFASNLDLSLTTLSGWCQNCDAVHTFPNLFCLDISLSSRNVLLVYPTLHFMFSIMC